MRRVRCVADEDDVAGVPVGVRDAGEALPGLRPLVGRDVGQERVVVEPGREEPGARGDGRVDVESLEPRGAPRAFVALDDERRVPGVEPVGVSLKYAVRVLDEQEGEGVEQAGRPEPDEAGVADVQVGTERVGVVPPDGAVHAVRRDDQVGVGQPELREVRVIAHVSAKAQLRAELARPAGEDLKQRTAGDAGEAVPARGDDRSLDVDVDVVPSHEGAGDLGVGLGLGGAEGLERLLREHDPPPVRVVRPVPLEHHDLVRRVRALHENGEVQAGRPAPHRDVLHG
jgi:hypothetical protein